MIITPIAQPAKVNPLWAFGGSALNKLGGFCGCLLLAGERERERERAREKVPRLFFLRGRTEKEIHDSKEKRKDTEKDKYKESEKERGHRQKQSKRVLTI